MRLYMCNQINCMMVELGNLLVVVYNPQLYHEALDNFLCHITSGMVILPK